MAATRSAKRQQEQRPFACFCQCQKRSTTHFKRQPASLLDKYRLEEFKYGLSGLMMNNVLNVSVVQESCCCANTGPNRAQTAGQSAMIHIERETRELPLE